MSENLYQWFQSRFPENPNKPALIHADGSPLSYTELDRETARLAGWLGSLGLKPSQPGIPGDRVSAQVPKSVNALLLYLACLRGGFVFHPMNPAYQREELRYFLENAEPKLVVCDPQREESFAELVSPGMQLHTLGGDGSGSLTEAALDAEPRTEIASTEADNLVALLYSSGTTGRPKGVMLSNRNLRSNAAVLVQAWGFTDKDVLVHALPIFHTHGLFVAVGCTLGAGATMHWLPKFDPESVLERLPHSTAFMGVPTYYTRLLQSPGLAPESCGSVRLFVSGSAPLLEETFRQFQERTGHTILERYGMSEIGMHLSNPLAGERRAGTVGMPLPQAEIRICDERDQPVGPDTPGGLQVRGPNVFSEYWKLPEKTAEEFTSDGWFRTGDLAQRDTDGYVTLVGRGKDLIISGGLNVYPKEVEQVLDALPGVLESAVIGVPHPDFGEAVTAVVIPEPEATLEPSALIAAVKEQLAGFKCPKAVHFLPELPRNAMGKVQKNELRQQFGGG